MFRRCLQLRRTASIRAVIRKACEARFVKWACLALAGFSLSVAPNNGAARALSSQGGESSREAAQPTVQAPASGEGGSQLIRPGRSVGPLKLGATRDEALQLFNRKPDQSFGSYSSGCESDSFNWVDWDKSRPLGNIFVYTTDGVVTQIESATTRYHTTDGVSIHASPGDVRRRYKGLQAYVLSNFTSEAEGDRPLVYWIDYAKGIAFAFAYYPEKSTRYLFAIIVFRPNTEICPIGGRMESAEKRKLPPYSLEPTP
jgi:hypothetical protein